METIKVQVGTMSSDRFSAPSYRWEGIVDMPLTAERNYDIDDFWCGLNGLDIGLEPNNPDKDIPKIIANIKAGKIWSGGDIYGEGSIGFAPLSTPKNELKLAVMEALFGEENNE